MYQTLERLSKDAFDVAIVEQLFMAPYRDVIDAPALLGEQNVESELLAQMADRKLGSDSGEDRDHITEEARRMREYENRVWPDFAIRSAVSENDREEIQRRARIGETILVENGTDPAYRLRRVEPSAKNLLFAGSLEYFPNVDGILYFLEEIWPHVQRRDPSTRLTVAGRNPPSDVRALAARHGVTLIPTPPDMRAIAALASVSVVPLRIGSGTRLKILDAMALGLPVVTTSIGCGGLAVDPNEHLLVRDDPREFAEAVLQLLGDRATWSRLRTNGFELVEQRYAWSRVLDPLDKKLWQLADLCS